MIRPNVSSLGILAVAGAALAMMGCDPAGPGTFACGLLNDSENVYVLDEAGPGELFVFVDTVSSFTTFDPAVQIIELSSRPETPSDVVGTQLDRFDDDVECTFPPPAFRCPLGTVSIGTSPVAIVVERVGFCEGDSGDFDLTVNLDGVPAQVSYLGSR
jgi:hypothetical protein